MDVGDGVFNVRREVGNATAAVGPRQMVVHPSDQDFLRGQLHQVLERLALLQQSHEPRTMLEVDVRQKPDLANKRQHAFSR